MADLIDELQALDDAALMTRIGADRQLANFKKQLAEMAQFTGTYRAEAVERLDRAINPQPNAQEINWITDDIQRELRMKSSKSNGAVEELNNTDPASLAPPAKG